MSQLNNAMAHVYVGHLYDTKCQNLGTINCTNKQRKWGHLIFVEHCLHLGKSLFENNHPATYWIVASNQLLFKLD